VCALQARRLRLGKHKCWNDGTSLLSRRNGKEKDIITYLRRMVVGCMLGEGVAVAAGARRGVVVG
jgi:hypothetical protein